MPDVFEQRHAYSSEAFSRFQEDAEKALGSHGQEAAIALTGSIAKDKLSQGSDLDVLVFTKDAVGESRMRIHECVSGIRSPEHPLEIYVTANREEWKWLLRNSELIASDIYFSRFLAGNRQLYEDVLSIAEQPENDNHNQRNYFTYNWIYRDRQLKRKSQTSLKYRPGGFREMQLLDWISRRLLHSKKTHPEDQLKDMVAAGMIEAANTSVVVDQYAKLLKAKTDPEIIIDHSTSLRVWHIMEKMRETVLMKIAPSHEWMNQIISTIRDGAYPSVENSENNDVSQLLCKTWDSASSDVFASAYEDRREDWAIRAALALNRHTPHHILRDIKDLDFLDMPDIHKFLHDTHGI